MKRRGLITFVFLGVIVFAGLALYGDLPDLLNQISSFPLAYWFMALALALANYVFRMVRWHYYLRLLGIEIGVGASAAIFMSGLSMAISPGRVGELSKSYFLKQKLDVLVALSSPVVVAERVTDLMALLLLSLWGLTLVPWGWAIGVVLLGIFGLFILLVVSPWGSDKLLRFPLPRRWRPFLDTSRGAFRQIFSVKPLAIALLLGLLAWFAEGCALWLVLGGLDAPGSLVQVASIYAVATLLGAVTMLPGGLVGTEVSMVALLRQIDPMSKPQASTATFIIRVCTLWFAVLVGLLALVYVQFHMPRKAPEAVDPLTLFPDASGQTG